MNKSRTHIIVVVFLWMGTGDNSDYAGGFKPGPPNQSKHTRDTYLKQLFLKRDRRK